mmetsp:Transcript_27087/g.81034  ORF Transcript_27087/g.81034 Transcript_27087/m.81034 type:complete len:305 (-) Transcript_27087:269-1183(-)
MRVVALVAVAAGDLRRRREVEILQHDVRDVFGHLRQQALLQQHLQLAAPLLEERLVFLEADRSAVFAPERAARVTLALRLPAHPDDVHGMVPQTEAAVRLGQQARRAVLREVGQAEREMEQPTEDWREARDDPRRGEDGEHAHQRLVRRHHDEREEDAAQREFAPRRHEEETRGVHAVAPERAGRIHEDERDQHESEEALRKPERRQARVANIVRADEVHALVRDREEPERLRRVARDTQRGDRRPERVGASRRELGEAVAPGHDQRLDEAPRHEQMRGEPPEAADDAVHEDAAREAREHFTGR